MTLKLNQGGFKAYFTGLGKRSNTVFSTQMIFKHLYFYNIIPVKMFVFICLIYGKGMLTPKTIAGIRVTDLYCTYFLIDPLYVGLTNSIV